MMVGKGRARRLWLVGVIAMATACLTKANPFWGRADAGTEGGASGTTTTAGTTSSGGTSSAGTTTDGGTTSDAGSTSMVTTGTTTEAATDTDGAAWCDGTVVIDEPFDDVPMEGTMWNVYEAGAGANAETRSGELWITATTASSAAYWGFLTYQAVPANAVAGVEIAEAPGALLPTELYFGLQTAAGDGLYFGVTDGDLELRYLESGGGFVIETAIPYVAADHRWIQIVYRTDKNMAWLETSPAGQVWTPVFQPIDLTTRGIDLNGASLELGMGVYSGTFDGDVGAVDNLYLCATP